MRNSLIFSMVGMRRRHPEELRVEEHPDWSPTRLDTAELCMKFYWLKYIKHVKYPINSSMVRGKLLHYEIENFWKKDEETGLLVPKYSYSGFIGRTIGDWKRFYAKGKEIGGGKMDEVEWDYDGQQWDKKYHGEIAEMAGRVYSRYLQEEPRIKSEVELHAEFEGLRIMAIIDELRKNLVVRDHKSGYKKPTEKYLENNIQMTDYLLCLFIALSDIRSPISREVYPDYFSIPLNEFLDRASIEIHHVPRSSTFPKFDKESGTWDFPKKPAQTEIYPANRNIQSINDLVLQLQAKERQIREREFIPRKGRHCGDCLARNICNDYSPEEEHNEELRRNMPLFAYSNLAFGNMKKEPGKTDKQKIMRFKYVPGTPKKDSLQQRAKAE